MTPLEARLARQNLNWVRTDNAFTTVNKGFGFVVYYRDDRNWLAVLTQRERERERERETAWLLDVYKTTPPVITGTWTSHAIKQMFEVPVTNEFLTHVIESAFPEMLTV